MPINNANKRVYEHIFSLGYNCEVSFQLQKNHGYLDSDIFSWTYSYSLNQTIETLVHFESIASAGFAAPDPLYECLNTHIRFHGRAPFSRLPAMTKAEKEADLQELISRVAYLKKKFLTSAQDGKKNLYVVKVLASDEKPDDSLTNQLNRLFETLKGLVSNEFDLLAIVEEPIVAAISRELTNPHIFVRSVSHFNPDENVQNFDTADNEAWQAIFSEFRLPFSLKIRHLPKTLRGYAEILAKRLIKKLKK